MSQKKVQSQILTALVLSGSFVLCVQAAPIQNSKPIRPASQKAGLEKVVASVLPSPAQAQQGVFAYLKQKCGCELVLPDYPANNLLSWTRQNFETAGNDSKLLYPAVYRQLLVAQQLLADKNPQQQRRGLRVVHNANFKIAMRLKDKQLSAQLFDGFVLPYISAASTGGRGTLSRQRLLQDAASAYRLAGEKDKQLAVLRLLVKVADEEKNTDGADWARIKLADVLSAQGQYQEAIANLKAVKSSNMSGSKQWIPALEEKQRQQEQEKTKSEKQ